MNSFKAVKDACTYEVSRQLEEYNSKNRIAFKTGFKRTMGWDEPSGQTIAQAAQPMQDSGTADSTYGYPWTFTFF